MNARPPCPHCEKAGCAECSWSGFDLTPGAPAAPIEEPGPTVRESAALLELKGLRGRLAVVFEQLELLAREARSIQGRLGALEEREVAAALAPSVGQVSPEAVLRAVAAYYDVKVSDLKGERRSRNITVPRQVAMYLARRLTGYSYPKLGAAMHKNHATIISGEVHIRALLRTDAGVRQAVAVISRQLGAELA